MLFLRKIVIRYIDGCQAPNARPTPTDDVEEAHAEAIVKMKIKVVVNDQGTSMTAPCAINCAGSYERRAPMS